MFCHFEELKVTLVVPKSLKNDSRDTRIPFYDFQVLLKLL